MHPQRDIDHLRAILESYLDGSIDGWALGRSFHRAFNLGERSRGLTAAERSILSPLSTLIGRFNDIEADLKAHPKAFVEDSDLRLAITHALEALSRKGSSA